MIDQTQAAAKIRRALAEMEFPPREAGTPHRLWWADYKANEEALRRRVKEETGALFDESGFTFRIRLAGRAATSTSGFAGALHNWCKAAEKAAN